MKYMNTVLEILKCVILKHIIYNHKNQCLTIKITVININVYVKKKKKKNNYKNNKKNKKK